MTWPEGVLGRALAAGYLIAFPAVYAGVVWSLILEITGAGEIPAAAVVMWGFGAVVIVALSFVLRHRAPGPGNRLSKGMSGDQRMYHRLALGLELPGAWRAVRRTPPQ
ncbi:hypothetical protein [Kribbella sp.]|uniref:hypothetical protein n=1 Tax=Kribbella sp. TaxID=1871183 RepID=UPI002D51FA5F|nr:hypothetical protein [Kribbella sp.]HZX07059.1 hypothetical protein [Kribbella sp.]